MAPITTPATPTRHTILAAPLHGPSFTASPPNLEGHYAWVQHPQYDGFLLVMIGFLLQWPAIPTLVMFPVLDWPETYFPAKSDASPYP
jgi:hypothetical protein